MSIPKLSEDLNIIQKLSNLPNSADGLSADELKAKFDEGVNIIQTWLNDILNPAIIAEKIPFAPTEEIGADNIQNAIELVQEHTRLASSGTILDGSITKEKLYEQLLFRTYGGRVWVSDAAPTQDDNVAADFPLGQVWLSPDKAKMWIQMRDGEWWPMCFDPDEGKDNMFLQYINGQKVWSDKETAIANLGSLRIETGTYVGTPSVATRTLTVTPKLLVIHPNSGAVKDNEIYWDNPIVLANGAASASPHKQGHAVKLEGNEIKFFIYGNENVTGEYGNRSGETYTWTAIY